MIDFFESTASLYGQQDSETPGADAGELEAKRAKSRVQALASFPAHVLATDFDNLAILKAGRFDDQYPERIRKFDWELFHRQDPGFFREFRQFLMEKYDYVLIDSRTGLTDTSGICVRQMPEKLVLVFVPNNQNVDGVLDVARRVRRFRIGSSDLRPLTSFPLASRIDGTNERLRVTWRNGGKLDGDEIPGYQKVFEDLFKNLYELDECDLGAYFDATQIKHDSDYAYGEKIAARRGTTDRLSLGYAFANFTQRLTTLSVPWESLPEEQDIETAKRREQAASAREEKARWKVRLLSIISVSIALLGLVATVLSWVWGYGKSRETAVLATAKAASDPLEQALLLTELEDSSPPAGGVELARQVAALSLPMLVLRGHTGAVDDVSFSPDGSRIATASADGTARVWKADGTGEPLVLRSSFRRPLTTVAWSPHWNHPGEKESLLTASTFEVGLWDWQAHSSGYPVLYRLDRIITAAFNPNGQVLVVGSQGLQNFGGKPSERVVRLRSGILRARFGLNGTVLATSSQYGAEVWNLENGHVTLINQLPDLPVETLAISPSGRYLVTSSGTTTKLWDLQPKSPQVLWGPDRSGSVEAISFSPDSRLLALGGSDGTTSVYTLSGSSSTATMRGHGGAVWSVAFSPDSKLLATASTDKTVRLWNLAWQPPGSNLDWKGLLKYLREETKACLSAEQRSRLLSETRKEAYEKYAACEHRYGRTALPQTSNSKASP
ncbi:MAG TPA: WD40 repeat domain-containing protein [Thermoanaerobaculia bacterium]|nr:WD40 repeat domain-containing protein [Thermoanaerobaculia bacterium]